MDTVRRALNLLGLPFRAAFIGLIKVYRSTISGLFGQRCRFYPTCSAYAEEAVRVHGFVKGLGLATWRLLRCSPLTPGGVDHVPHRRSRSSAVTASTAYDTVTHSVDEAASSS